MTIDAVVSEWWRMVNDHYFYDNSPSRCRPYPYMGRDCSTFAADGLNAGFPGSVDPCTNSFWLAGWCHDAPRPEWFIQRFGPGQGTFITRDQAQTVECLAFHGSDFGRRPDFSGDGHVECVLGQGLRTIGAHSHASGVGVLNDGLADSFLEWFAVPPCFLAELGTVPIDPATLDAIRRLLEWKQRVTDRPLHYRQTNGDVTILNNLLINRVLLDQRKKSNTYGRATREAVNHLKRLTPSIHDKNGEVFGSEAAAALLAPR